MESVGIEMHRKGLAFALLVASLAPGSAPAAEPMTEEVRTAHAIAVDGAPKYGADFEHFDYADPDAPKGGTLKLSSGNGGFDTLNNLPVQGVPPRNIGLIYDSLMVGSQDEISVWYGLLAESVTYPADGSWATFTLRPEARFGDGEPVTAEDIAWTIHAYQEHAQPFLKAYVDAVSSVEVIGDHRIKVTFDRSGDRISNQTGSLKPITQLASLPILAKHWWEAEGRDISRSTLEPPVGSGPYRLVSVEPGRRLVYERNPDYWGRNLPVNRGLWNFDRIEYTYFRDRTVEFEAFKAGQSDLRHEFTSLFWATGYDIPAVKAGRLVKAEFPGQAFRGMQGYFFNTRRPMFADARVREALGLLYDFEWVNEHLFYGLYERLDTYFLAPGYSAEGLPTPEELALLEPHRDKLPETVFTEEPVPPRSDGSGADRRLIREATRLLREAGYELRGSSLINTATGEPLRFEILLQSPTFERVTQPWIRTLRRVGIQATMRVLDPAQFQARYQDRDFEVVSFAYTFYPPPGREEADRFGSAAADQPGSANLIGIKSQVVDALLETLIGGKTLDEKQAAARALDRVLRAGHYVVPHWHKDGYWIAYWDRFGFPETQPPYDLGQANGIAFQPTWWIDPERDAALKQQGRT